MAYQPTQHGPLGYFEMLVAMAIAISAWRFREDPTASITLWVAAGMCLLLSLMLRSLAILDGGEILDLRFGSISILQTTNSARRHH